MAETVTHSVAVSDLSLDELVQVAQGLGRQIDKLREQRAYLRAKIEERLANGERESSPGDAAAPGAVLDASTV